MNESSDFLTRQQAASLAGVSVETIEQFGRFGLLRVVSHGAEPQYSEGDVRAVFRLSPRPAPVSAPTPEPPPPERSPDRSKTNGSATVQEERPEKAGPVKDVTPEKPRESSLQPDLSHAFELLEVTRTLRGQVELLREERDWLRTRLEKLEERTERDQLLMLSQGETVRDLIQKRGPGLLGRALPWFRSTRRISS